MIDEIHPSAEQVSQFPGTIMILPQQFFGMLAPDTNHGVLPSGNTQPCDWLDWTVDRYVYNTGKGIDFPDYSRCLPGWTLCWPRSVFPGLTPVHPVENSFTRDIDDILPDLVPSQVTLIDFLLDESFINVKQLGQLFGRVGVLMD
jgi:hypothetical protein